MARNRKRAKERRARRPQPVGGPRGERRLDAPDPIGHATPDVELAEAQLAFGRPDAEVEPDLAEREELEAESEGDGELSAAPEFDDAPGAPAPSAAGELAIPASAAAAPRVGTGSRLINFLRGCWRELQRVQWPDRRQVIQATGVVLGFVIVAGVLLGVADWASGHIINYILYGHS